MDVINKCFSFVGEDCELDCVKTIVCKNNSKEEILAHKYFKNKRKTGEWFEITVDEVNNYFENNKDRIKLEVEMHKKSINDKIDSLKEINCQDFICKLKAI